jgi:hypothetical protein
MEPVNALRAATTFYLLLPVGVFAMGWLRLEFALPVLGVVGPALAVAARDAWRAQPRLTRRAAARMLPAGLVVLAWLLLSGAGGAGFQNDDYRASNALLRDLLVGDWPASFELDGQRVWLVYYVGYYLPAALVGKALGWPAATAGLWGGTAVGGGLARAWFGRLSGAAGRRGAGRWLLLAVIFCLAGGLDFFADRVARLSELPFSQHTEFWASYFQYSSQTTLLYWVPHHALVGWLLAGLVFDALDYAQGLGHLSLSLAAGLLWSPLAVLGVLPYLVLVAVVYGRTGRWRLVLRAGPMAVHAAAAGLALVVGLYLAANRYRFPVGWIWTGMEDAARLAWFYAAFWWVELEVSVALGLLWLGGGMGIEWRRWSAWGVSLAWLTMLPLVRVGFNNDLAMRGSIPALLVLWALAAGEVAEGGGSVRRRWARGLLVVVLAAGSLTSLAEMARSVERYAFGPPALNAVVASAEANPRRLVEQRAGASEALFFKYLAK